METLQKYPIVTPINFIATSLPGKSDLRGTLSCTSRMMYIAQYRGMTWQTNYLQFLFFFSLLFDLQQIFGI